LAPVIRHAIDGLEWKAMRWGFPPPPDLGDRPVTNIRNLTSPYWRNWLKPAYRCLVPFTSFAEWTLAPPKREVWFALPGEAPAMFAGIWRPWAGSGGPKSASIKAEHLLFGVLTCLPNAVVAPIHPMAMPMILATRDEQDAWLEAPASAVPALVRPLADALLTQI
jgi:putative SOS response-associated peptidase YedK